MTTEKREHAECGGELALTDGREIYPHRPDLFTRRFWICRPCMAYVGCHPGTTRPLGQPAGPALRQARIRAHAALDPLWQSGWMSRNDVYRELSGILGYEVHVAQSNEQQCERIIEACAALVRGEP